MTKASQIDDGRLLLLFDGYCGLCNRTVRWLLRHDPADRLRFAPLDSSEAAFVLARHGISPATRQADPTTILVVREFGSPAERVLARSEAVLALLAELPRPWWPAIAAVLRCIPRPIRDLGYRFVASWRYRIWGRVAQCPVPKPEERARFLWLP